jgi:hypothetical protein
VGSLPEDVLDLAEQDPGAGRVGEPKVDACELEEGLDGSPRRGWSPRPTTPSRSRCPTTAAA